MKSIPGGGRSALEAGYGGSYESGERHLRNKSESLIYPAFTGLFVVLRCVI